MKATELDLTADVYVHNSVVVPTYPCDTVEVVIDGYNLELAGTFPEKGTAFVEPEDATLAQIKVLVHEGEPTIRALYLAPTNQLVIRTAGEYRIRPTSADDMPPGTEVWGKTPGVITDE